MPALSVIVCTHNPVITYLTRTLEGLNQQSLRHSEWEFVLVDNASTVPLTDLGPLSGHPEARIVREDRIGLLNARLTGFRSTSAELAVLVDDDNILDPNYLATALDLADKWPILGAWGCQCHPDFEEPPPEWTRPYWDSLAIREFDDDRWSNVPVDSPSSPCGAGMCVRRAVLNHYLANLNGHPLRAHLGRHGNALNGGEDTDICLAAVDLGLGTGCFSSLHLRHIIPPRRLTEAYLTSLVEAITFSRLLQRYLRGQRPPDCPSRSQRIFEWYKQLRIGGRERRFQQAQRRGMDRARAIISEFEQRSVTHSMHS